MDERSQSTALTAGLSGQLAGYRRVADDASERLCPADWDSASRVLAKLFTLPSGVGVDDEAVIAAYRIAIHGEPLECIKSAVAAFISGRSGNGYRPSPPELGKAVRVHSDFLRRMRDRATACAESVALALERPMPEKAVQQKGFYAVSVAGSCIIGHDRFVDMVRRKMVPEGAYWQSCRLWLRDGTALLEPVGECEVVTSTSFPDADEWEQIHKPLRAMDERAV